MIRVILESPFGTRLDGSRATPEEIERNIRYARRAMLDCFKRGEAPFASHLLYPQIFNDATPDERRLGMTAGLAWAPYGEGHVIYVDHGITMGMAEGIARSPHSPVARYIGKEP